MADYSGISTLTTPAGVVTFNAGVGDYYYVDPEGCSGLDMAPIRAPIDEKPQTDGGIVHPFLKGPRHIVIAGLLIASTVSARTDLEDALTAALESIQTADGTWSWPAGDGSTRTLTVRCDVPATYPGGYLKRFIFGLVAANPTITIT